MDFLPGGFVEAKGVHLLAVGGGIGEPDLVVHDHRSGPSTPRDRCFPDDIFGFAPFDGQAAGLSIFKRRKDPVVVGAPEGGPLGLQGSDEEEGEEKADHEVGIRMKFRLFEAWNKLPQR